MFHWLIEALHNEEKWTKTFVVKAKSFGDATVSVAKHIEGCTFKSLGQYESLSLDKNVAVRVG